jgi:hypothetical protein
LWIWLIETQHVPSRRSVQMLLEEATSVPVSPAIAGGRHRSLTGSHPHEQLLGLRRGSPLVLDTVDKRQWCPTRKRLCIRERVPVQGQGSLKKVQLVAPVSFSPQSVVSNTSCSVWLSRLVSPGFGARWLSTSLHHHAPPWRVARPSSCLEWTASSNPRCSYWLVPEETLRRSGPCRDDRMHTYDRPIFLRHSELHGKQMSPAIGATVLNRRNNIICAAWPTFSERSRSRLQDTRYLAACCDGKHLVWGGVRIKNFGADQTTLVPVNGSGLSPISTHSRQHKSVKFGCRSLRVRGPRAGWLVRQENSSIAQRGRARPCASALRRRSRHEDIYIENP